MREIYRMRRGGRSSSYDPVVVFHTNRLILTPPLSPLADAACFLREENYFFRLLNTRWEFIINTDGVSAILKYSPHIYTVCPTTPNCRILYYYRNV